MNKISFCETPDRVSSSLNLPNKCLRIFLVLSSNKTKQKIQVHLKNRNLIIKIVLF